MLAAEGVIDKCSAVAASDPAEASKATNFSCLIRN